MNRSLLAGLIVCGSALLATAQTPTWTDMTTGKISGSQSGSDDMMGFAGVGVNRLTGAVIVNFTSNGLWKSMNKGATFTRLGPTSTGKTENSEDLQICQDNPDRIAIFALDGPSSYTSDGTNWTTITASPANTRGFDVGAIDWTSSTPRVMLALIHESGNLIEKSTNNGTNWTVVSGISAITDAWAPSSCMIGVLDSMTFIYGNSGGITRSANQGASWSSVSSVAPTTKSVVKFNGKYYFGAGRNVMVSSDKGLTWQTLGTSIPAGTTIYRGPYFGADENTFVVSTLDGDFTGGIRTIYKTTNAGTAWTKISQDAPPTTTTLYKCGSGWFGNITWDPINNVLYTSAMSNPVYKKELGQVNAVAPGIVHSGPNNVLFSVTSLQAGRFTVESATRGTVSIYNAQGVRLGASHVSAGLSTTAIRAPAGLYLVKFSSGMGEVTAPVTFR